MRTYLFMLSLLLGLHNLEAANSAAPNVLFIMADDLRPELRSFGSVAKTPNLDKLAARSVQFDRMYAQQAVCNPSRSSMLTGRRPDTLRVWSNSHHFREGNPDVTTMPLWFKEHGYTTRGIGKIFHNWHTTQKGDARSWSAPEFLHYANHGDDKPLVNGDLPPSSAFEVQLKYGATTMCEARDVPDEAYYDGRVANEAVRVLGEIKSGPFFLAVGFWKPHAPFNAPRKYWDLYQRTEFETFNSSRPEGAPEVAFHRSTEILGNVMRPEELSKAQAAEMRHGYFANISYLDAQIGRVLEALERAGVADRTVIVFVSDHGYHLGEHSLWGKTSNFELDARVPCFISVPGSTQAGRKTSSLSELVDLFPTLTALCKLPQPAGLEGTSLEPVLQNASGHLKPGAFTQHPRPAYFDREPDKAPKAMGVSVRTAAGRYTEWRDWKSGDTVAKELYLDNDEPAETKNQVDSPSLANIQAEAERLLRAQFPRTPHP